MKRMCPTILGCLLLVVVPRLTQAAEHGETGDREERREPAEREHMERERSTHVREMERELKASAEAIEHLQHALRAREEELVENRRHREEAEHGRRRGEVHAEDRHAKEGQDNRELMEFVKRHFPFFAERLRAMREHAPEECEDAMHEARGRYVEFLELRRHAPEAAELFLNRHKLEDRCHALAENMARTDSPEMREKLMAELRKTLNHAFEVMMRFGETELHNMEREMREIRSLLEKKQHARERIIARRLRQLMEEHGDEDEEVLNWW